MLFSHPTSDWSSVETGNEIVRSIMSFITMWKLRFYCIFLVFTGQWWLFNRNPLKITTD